MLTVEEAAKVGLVDEVIAPELVFDKSVEMALKFAALPSVARHRSKVIKRRCGRLRLFLLSSAFCIATSSTFVHHAFHRWFSDSARTIFFSRTGKILWSVFRSPCRVPCSI